MPESLREWDHSVSWSPAALSKRPLLAQHIGTMVASWSRLELQQALLLCFLSDDGNRIPVKMYTSLTGSAAQEACLTAAFTGRMGSALNEEYIAVSKIFRKRAIERNRVIHGVIGVGDAHPDGIIVCPADEFARHIADDLGFRAANALYRDTKQSIYPAEFLEQCLVYKDHDFKQINQRIRDATMEYIKLAEKVQNQLLQEKQLIHALKNVPIGLEHVLRAQGTSQPEPSPEDPQPKSE